MGNIVAVDMGVVILRCTIFDKNNSLFPYKIQKQILQKNPEAKVHFMNDLSFYSKEHGGTFHFMQFNILEADDFMKS